MKVDFNTIMLCVIAAELALIYMRLGGKSS